jgi:hypothetical protein
MCDAVHQHENPSQALQANQFGPGYSGFGVPGRGKSSEIEFNGNVSLFKLALVDMVSNHRARSYTVTKLLIEAG